MIGENQESATAGGNKKGNGSYSNKMPILEEYGTDLTKLAEEVNFLNFLMV